MTTAIERFLYQNGSAHGVIEFTLLPEAVRIKLAPWEGVRRVSIATFREVQLTSLKLSIFDADDPEGLQFPWDIIGFDSYELSAGRWEFVLHCSEIEWIFESAWPEVDQNEVEVVDR